ncbi:DNA adenine methylase [Thermodesulfovibrio yellowstonii]|uniref:Site-specific DNA-methyltransferase (adenine-specific) n=1 Tax=Thermodesulfovibrio yellowstonii TaxID=28262 RepID=A0A9W6GHW6_9BACT|nr:Dam family site-specific DNA-(adenine-N6)-methyltransferase [Thermodesulfovibrio islandicus]GLI54475.1 modification methylase [Thermodesulfovibrio islandicus]
MKITVKENKLNFIRYPGGKQKILNYILPFLPSREEIRGNYIEPFLGSGAVFFAIDPKNAILADINRELIDLFHGIRAYPRDVWKIYKSFPQDKEGYYRIRNTKIENDDLAFKAAKLLYLNRTCFKGMWRQNSNGTFNVGYGGQSRRWVINEELLIKVSERLKNSVLLWSDFESVIDKSKEGDFIFLDPPYKPGGRELKHAHYAYQKFLFSDYQRLSNSLKKATHRKVNWAMTISSHQDIIELFKEYYIYLIPKGTGSSPGILRNNSGEVLICNYKMEVYNERFF